MEEKNFEIFKRKGEKNRIFIRASKFKRLTKRQTEHVHSAIVRSKKAHEKIYQVQKTIENSGVPFVIFKTFSNHPDMGLDVDLIVCGDIDKLTKRILKKFNGKILDQSIASSLAGKVSIGIEDSPIIVELHEGKFSQIGEHTVPGMQIIKNSRLVRLYGKAFRVPSYEDEILITVIHRVYRHMSIRFSDVYNVKRILDNEKLNWGYILKNAKDVGIMPGLQLFLEFTEKYGNDIENMEKFPYYIKKRDFIKVYFGKVFNDMGRARIGSVLRMVTLYPSLLILESLLGKRFVNKFW